MKIRTKHYYPHAPVRRYDWAAWFDGQELWLIGHGATEGEAVADLMQQLWENGEAAA